MPIALFFEGNALAINRFGLRFSFETSANVFNTVFDLSGGTEIGYVELILETLQAHAFNYVRADMTPVSIRLRSRRGLLPKELQVHQMLWLWRKVLVGMVSTLN